MYQFSYALWFYVVICIANLVWIFDEFFNRTFLKNIKRGMFFSLLVFIAIVPVAQIFITGALFGIKVIKHEQN